MQSISHFCNEYDTIMFNVLYFLYQEFSTINFQGPNRPQMKISIFFLFARKKLTEIFIIVGFLVLFEFM